MVVNSYNSTLKKTDLNICVCYVSVAYAQIDWHDFVVVETVDFQPNEVGNLPPPTTPEEVGARLILQERYEKRPITTVSSPPYKSQSLFSAMI